MESTYKNAFSQVIEFLEDLEEQNRIKYYLVGGILVNLYSDFRITRDIDIAVDIPPSKITLEEYFGLLEKKDFQPVQDWDSTLILARDTNVVQFFDKSNFIRFDNHIIKKFSNNKFRKIGPIGLQKRVRARIFNIECWVASKEVFILSKLVYGGWQDYTDALGTWLRFRDELDQDYLDLISEELGIRQEYLLLKSGIDDPDEFFNKLKGI